MKFTILGDVHGDLNRCITVAEENPGRKILQLGDLGVGNDVSSAFDLPDSEFIVTRSFIPARVFAARLPRNFTFFPGNHDNRQECMKIPHCLGHFGEFNDLFFVSGGMSMDRSMRIEGVSWWPDEELSFMQANECMDRWIESPCRVVVSHDCPEEVASDWWNIRDRCVTRSLLQIMFETMQPDLWIFGHHHRSRAQKVGKTQFVCLDINETFDLDT